MLRINVNVNMNILRVRMLLILYICEVVYKTRVSAQFAKAHFAPTLVLYTTMMMKQYHYKHFYANLDFGHFS